MQDRVPLYPGRVTLTPVSGQANTFDLVRADQPTQEGTPLNKASLLKDTTAALFGKTNAAVPDDILSLLSKSALAHIEEKYTKTTIGTAAVGKTIKLNVSGKAKEFIVVHQGKPSSLYDDSCNGTWLLMKDIYENRAWNSSNINSYKESSISSYLNSTFLGLFDRNIQEAVKQVKIPYVNGTGGSAVASGANGLPTKIFLLSGYEVGFQTSDNNYLPVDGAKLSYFEYGNGTSANNKRIASLNGSASNWWFRSPVALGTEYVFCVNSSGVLVSDYKPINMIGIRPSLILPSSFEIYTDSAGNIYTEQEYETKFTDVLGTELTIGTQIEDGSYVGTGTYGSGSQNSLAIGFASKMIVIQGTDDLAVIIVPSGRGSSLINVNNCTIRVLTASITGNVVEWYSTHTEEAQMNVSGQTYHYFAIG